MSDFFVAGEALHQRTLYREEKHRQWAEAERRRLEEEEREAQEKRDVEALVQEALAWKNATAVRDYLRAVRAGLDNGQGASSGQGRAWLETSEARVAQMDPLARRLAMLHSGPPDLGEDG